MTGIISPADEMVEAYAHLGELQQALRNFDEAAQTAVRWGRQLADALMSGSRLLVVGNGGSAAQAQHLSSEIVGRYRADRPPFSAVALHSEPSALTAIVNDYGIDEMFARQVVAHGRPGDVCILMSTSGTSRNIVVAAQRARRCGLTVWAMTGRRPSPLAAEAQDVLSIDASTTAAVQELHLVALHLLCEAFDARVDQPADGRVDQPTERELS